MASAGPVAVFLLLAICGTVVLPIIWWVLAFWQHRRGFKAWFKVSMALSLTPILGGAMLYVGNEGSLISAKPALITFFLTPVANVVAILVTLATLLISEFRHKHC